jgi:transposase
MAKYSYDFKKQVVDAYLRGEGGYTFLAEKYGVKNRRQVLNWVHYYEQLGDEGLMRARKNDIYSFDFKLSMVESYLSSEFSYQELALENGINNAALISKWVNEFRVDGPDALRSHKKGRKKTLNKSKTDNKSQVQEERAGDTSAEHVKELEDELLKLRIENAFLKELRRLRLEDEAKMRERHSSSVASEENSN